jgi:hypothetical protein
MHLTSSLFQREVVMRRILVSAIAVAIGLGTAACEDDDFFVDGRAPAPPRNLQVQYFNRAVELTWELAPNWDGETFRVYSKRVSDLDYFLIAEVTSCAGGFCEYRDVNVLAGESYDYIVSAVDPSSGLESDSEPVTIAIPFADAPDVPVGARVIALDEAAYLTWDSNARSAADFLFYRVYFDDPQDGLFLLGETDSEGFVDLLVQNGQTATYRVSSVDDAGNESDMSASASGVPRPDYHGELIYAFEDRPTESGFRFQEFDDIDPLVDGQDGQRHFRLEVDGTGWWLVPGPGTEIHAQGFVTTALKCGLGADADCVSLDFAPSTGYTTGDVAVYDQTSYPMRVTGDDGRVHYGVIRPVLLGTDQNGEALMIFDWAYQLQAGNVSLAPRGP